jgi:hypothetical protein
MGLVMVASAGPRVASRHPAGKVTTIALIVLTATAGRSLGQSPGAAPAAEVSRVAPGRMPKQRAARALVARPVRTPEERARLAEEARAGFARVAERRRARAARGLALRRRYQMAWDAEMVAYWRTVQMQSYRQAYYEAHGEWPSYSGGGDHEGSK